jgi:hypothetical protein
MKGSAMRRTLLAGIAIGCLVLGAPTAAQAANPDVQRINDSGTFTDENFCGTGETIEGTFTVKGVEFLSPNQEVDYANVTSGKVTYTNPETGTTVVNHFAGRFTFRSFGDPDGIHYEELTNIGLPEQYRLENGRVITLDAGKIVFLETFNGDQFVSEQILLNQGPHPQAESQFELFCDVIPGALDLV